MYDGLTMGTPFDPDDPGSVLGTDPPQGGDAAERPLASEVRIEAGKTREPPDRLRYPADSAIHDKFAPEALATPIRPEDGLPDHSLDGDGSNATAHPFTYETVCCIEDAREWVSLPLGEALSTDFIVLFELRLEEPQNGLSHVTIVAPLAARHSAAWHEVAVAISNAPKYDNSGVLYAREVFDAETQEGFRDLFGRRAALRSESIVAPPLPPLTRAPPLTSVFVPDRTGDAHPASRPTEQVQEVLSRGVWQLVGPRRPVCIHYKRQHFANDAAPDPNELGHSIFFRDCTHPARRSIGGASMSLMDEAIYGCDFRHPPDKRSLEMINARDERVLRDRPHEILVPAFGLGGDDVHVSGPLRPPVPLDAPVVDPTPDSTPPSAPAPDSSPGDSTDA